MRILLRRDDKGNEYVWKDATYKGEKYIVNNGVQDVQVYETNIVAVEGHEKAGYVVCKTCGEFVKNTPEEIAKHYETMEKNRDCSKCCYVSFDNNRKIHREMVDNGDGTYSVTEEFKSELYCGNNYYKKKVSEMDIRKQCIAYACRRNGMRPPKDIFAAYPGVFDTAITSDVLLEKKYKLEGHDGKYFLYDMKSRGTIKACVNKSGIVECFRVSSNGDKLYFHYSEKYDKLFYTGGYNGTYEEGKPSWFRETKFNEALEKIRALYKGANK
jgi:hypothetical protein